MGGVIPMKKQYVIEYWGILADRRGMKQETVGTHALNVRELFDEIFREQASAWSAVVKAVINDEFVPWDRTLSEGDRIAFLPPMSGG